jgi:branched-chain amino acid transport system ATP-binding protein
MPDYLVAHRARVARTFQNIRLFQAMTVLENLLVAQHNSLMWASGFTVLGALGLRSYARAERSAIDKARYWLDRTALTDRADDPAGELPYGGQRRPPASIRMRAPSSAAICTRSGTSMRPRSF